MSRIGNQIKEARTQKNLTAKQLAKKCGVAESFILDVETGKRIINEKLLEKISKILGKNLDQSMSIHAQKDEPVEKKNVSKSFKSTPIQPNSTWQNALSGIIQNVPISSIDFKTTYDYKKFPIIHGKIEGFHPEKLAYVTIPDDTLAGFHIKKNDQLLILLNQELLSGTFSLIELNGKRSIKKINRISNQQVELISYPNEKKVLTKSIKEVKVIGRGLRIERNLK